jgi:hypothetical protein
MQSPLRRESGYLARWTEALLNSASPEHSKDRGIDTCIDAGQN